MPALMLQGTGSNVGKSLLVAGLCRIVRRCGLNVAPFKPQNMSNNAAVTADGGEIGRAQALQARAAGLALHTDMNPVLLKPESDHGAQVVVQGRRWRTARARQYAALKPQLLARVLESFRRLERAHNLVLVEGAGSLAEVNLRVGDIANMGFAEAAGVPVVLVGDIDRGGIIAQLVGAKAVLPADDAQRVKGFLVNRFRGDPSLFDNGYALIERETGWPGFGVLPWFEDAWRLPAEDGQDLYQAMPVQTSGGDLHVACLIFPRISNFDDLDPLAQEAGVRLTVVRGGQALPGDVDWVILPGSKSTRGDLAFLRQQGWDIDLQAHWRRGGRILGLCGGYQMLGRVVVDPDEIEGPGGESKGLGLLNVATRLTTTKRLNERHAVHAASGCGFHGYEMHIGETNGPDCARPFAFVDGRPEGAISADGRVVGTYLHGIFADDDFRSAWLVASGGGSSALAYDAAVEATLDGLADHMERHLDVTRLLKLAR